MVLRMFVEGIGLVANVNKNTISISESTKRKREKDTHKEGRRSAQCMKMKTTTAQPNHTK